MTAVRLALFALVFSLMSAGWLRAQEYIIASGGPALRKWEEYRVPQEQHDRFWGNFIRSARIRIDQLRASPGGEHMRITWLVYRPGYETRAREDQVKRPPYIADVNEIIRVATERRVNLVWFDSKEQFIRHLNDRRAGKITGFEFFGHSNKFCFLFDYSNDVLGVSSCYLHCVDLKRLKRGLFAPNAHVKSWGCHTGEYMSRIWKRATGHPMIGAIGKTDYSSISDGKTLPIVNGRWTQ